MRLKFFLGFFLLIAFFLSPGIAAESEQKSLSVMHYFADEFGRSGMESILARFSETTQIEVIEKPVGHEDFKTTILELAATGDVPDVSSYWAGARTQFLVDSGVLAPLDRLWEKKRYRQQLLPGLEAPATSYNDQHYLVPVGCHVVGFFYNPKLFQQAGIAAPPKTWQEFLAVCEKLKNAGIHPLALGAKNRWPAQFWFDYLLLRTAGPVFRQQLMTGEQSYLAPEVAEVMQLWSELLMQGYFASGTLSNGWDDVADLVASGRAAMTLMGTWIGGYWRDKGLQPQVDFDYFSFPAVSPQGEQILLGAVDGFVVSANSKNRAAAEQLVDFIFGELEVQKQWALQQGTIAPNRDVSQEIYDPVMQKILAQFEQADGYVFNYDLATPPPVAEVGLSMFSRFLARPENYREELNFLAKMAAALQPRKNAK